MDGGQFEAVNLVTLWKEFYPDIPQLLDVLPSLWTSGEDKAILKEGLFKRSSAVSAAIKSNVLILNKGTERKKSIESTDILSVHRSKGAENKLKIKFKRSNSSSKNLSLKFENSETCVAWKSKIEQLIEKSFLKPSLEQYSKPLRFLNDGAYGCVFHCKRLEDNLDVAIKEIPVKNLKHINMLNQERSALERVLSFASPFVLPMLSSFRAFSGNLYFVMPLMHTDLHKVLLAHGEFVEEDVKFYIAELLCGLKAIHRAGLVHRDLKLENILVNGEGHIRICDFGLAKFLGDDYCEEQCGMGLDENDGVSIKEKRSETFCGTTSYLSPEMLHCKEWGVGKSSDFWQVGIIMYELLTKKSPFKRKKGGAKATYEAIKYANPKMPSGLSDAGKSLLGGLIEKNFWNRLGENGGVEEIRSHQFFVDVNWDDVESESIIAPFYPSEIGKIKQKIDDSKKNAVEGKQKCGTMDADVEGKLVDTRLEFGLVRGQKKYAKAFIGFDFVQKIGNTKTCFEEKRSDRCRVSQNSIPGELSKQNTDEDHPLSLQF
eukprot:g440.t1